MKSRLQKVIALSLTGIFPFVFLISCSTKVNFLSRGGFSEPTETKSSNKGSISQFVSKVRPYRGNPDSHTLLACYYQARDEHKKAIEEFEKVLLIEPNHVQAHNGMGISYDHLKDYSRAAESYQRALRLSPETGYILNNLGYSYLLQGRLDEAISALQKAVTMNGRDGRFHNNLGLAYAVKGHLDLAMFEFQAAGDEAKAHYNIAQFYHKRGLYRIAQIHYSQALALDPSFIHARVAAEAVDTLAKIFQPATQKVEAGKGPVSESIPAPSTDADKVAVSAPPVTLKAETTRSSTPPEMETPTPNGLEAASLNDGENPPPSPEAALKAEAVISPSLSRQAKDGFISTGKVGIEISNGNGANGMAKKIGHYLKEKGLPVARITNADHFNYQNTRIYFQNGYQEAARRVAEQLPGSQSMEERKSFDRPNINVKVLVGKNLLSNKILKGGKQS